MIDGDEARAFAVARVENSTWVVELTSDGRPFVLGSASDCEICLPDPSVNSRHAVLRWDGEHLRLRTLHELFLAGKRFEGATDLKPGDEIAVGGVLVVVGIAVPMMSGGRRALTHHEFRERLYEELARADRGGRPTCLAMIRASSGEGGRVAAAALEGFRTGDLVGSYAPDEAEVLLPDTDVETASIVVQRVLRQAELEGTVGIAVAPNHGDSPERLLRAAREALEEALHQRKLFALPPPRGERTRKHASGTPISEDPTSRAVFVALEEAASDRKPILLLGEKSAGKSVWASFLHRIWRPAGGAFVTIHCAAVDEDRLEETLSHAHLSAAIGGTLFLDEVGELLAAGQERLREWLAEGHEVRVVAATHRILRGLVDRSAFDRALFDILDGHSIEVPSLRNRPGDILPMATRFAHESGATHIQFSPGAIARLRSYPWPGNVLELRNAIERAIRLARDGEVLAEHLPSEPIALVSSEGRLREHVDSVERDAIIKALADCNHNQTHASKRLGISRRALIYKMEKYGLKRPPKGLSSRRPQ